MPLHDFRPLRVLSCVPSRQEEMGIGALSFAKLFLGMVTGAFIRGKARLAPLPSFPGK